MAFRTRDDINYLGHMDGCPAVMGGEARCVCLYAEYLASWRKGALADMTRQQQREHLAKLRTDAEIPALLRRLRGAESTAADGRTTSAGLEDDRAPTETATVFVFSNQHFFKSTDAAVWAKAFMELMHACPEKIDEGCMIGWFANAIERGREAARVPVAETTRLVERPLGEQAAYAQGWRAGRQALTQSLTAHLGQLLRSETELCDDEGCPHSPRGAPHVCVSPRRPTS